MADSADLPFARGVCFWITRLACGAVLLGAPAFSQAADENRPPDRGADKAAALHEKPELLLDVPVGIDADAHVTEAHWWGKGELSTRRAGAGPTLDERLAAFHKEHPDGFVTVTARPATPFFHVERVLIACAEAKVDTLKCVAGDGPPEVITLPNARQVGEDVLTVALLFDGRPVFTIDGRKPLAADEFRQAMTDWVRALSAAGKGGEALQVTLSCLYAASCGEVLSAHRICREAGFHGVFFVPGHAVGGVRHPWLDLGGGPDKFPDGSPMSDARTRELAGAVGGGGGPSGDAISIGPETGGSRPPSTRPAEENPYGRGLPPFSVPPVREVVGPRTTFCGSSGNARKIVFFCDATGSMMKNFDSLRVELRKSVEMLRPPQSFNIVFFQENAKPPLEKSLMFVTPANKRRAYEYIDTYAARGPTDTIPSLAIALEMKPELMYFLTDPACFPDKEKVLEMFRKANPDKKMKVNTIAFLSRSYEDEKFLKQLAEENGGTFRAVTEEDLGK